MLENDGVLPLKKGSKVALFGRNQEGYIKSGTGSGGLVRVEKAPVIWDSFKENGVFEIDNDLVKIYKNWIADNPYDNGEGCASEPWSQKEMPVTTSMADSFAKKNDVAVIVLGRTAGESKDNCNVDGSYKLSNEEKELVKNVSSAFEKTVVVLNVGNLIDLSFMDENKISALLYVWRGGQEGAKENLKALVRAQNDVYMVCESAENKSHNILEGLKEGYIVRSDLQRCAKNLLRYIMTSPTFLKYVDGGCTKPNFEQINDENMKDVFVAENIKSGDRFESVEYGGDNVYIFELVSNADSLA
ncbi:MAG: glycoside hydrolase family 3 C-terminal domain-containing protein [Acutalibacteraceae bacterium]|nr:glycoside hydrolase family 3 C-terminal domain-containing protein [Acutalibacteraceae bacterium]